MSRRQAQQRDFLTTFFKGRSGRRQFWSFYAFAALPAAALGALGLLDGAGRWQPIYFVLALIWALLFLVPLTAAMSRRFHDVGWSGKWALPQILVVAAVTVFGVIYPTATRPPVAIDCLDIGFVFRLDGTNQRDVTRTPEEQAACEKSRASREAYDDRMNTTTAVAITAVLLSHIATLVLLLRPSQPGSNRYGPNPHEVTP